MVTYPQSPELVIGLVGPIGCDLDGVQDSLLAALRAVRYTPYLINLSDSIERLIGEIDSSLLPLDTMSKKIDAGNRVRESFQNNAILAIDAIHQIRSHRLREHEIRRTPAPPDDTLENLPADRTAYIIRQLKRPEEIEQLSRVYGKMFVQVSVAHDKAGRIARLTEIIRRENPLLNQEAWSSTASAVVLRDEDEKAHDYGQRLKDIFQLGDVFIDTSVQDKVGSTVLRFIYALFGRNDISPTRDEYGTYLAKAAALRSADVSRQVGAALMSPLGDTITLGCNEVPKPLGGNYWHEDDDKHRDIDHRSEANKEEITRIVHDFLRVLEEKELLADGKDRNSVLADSTIRKAINKSLVGGITEYGRMVHAEMNAITDAARLGRSVAGAVLYVTTFPCHNCAKHVIASGIVRVVYIEPYPKSRTELLYSEAIALNRNDRTRVSFEHFSGISPRRYRDIFEKEDRRDEKGKVLDWYQDICAPRVGVQVTSPAYAELFAIAQNSPSASATT